MGNKVVYSFTTTIRKYEGKSVGNWHFASLPIEISKEIREHYGELEEGWGRFKVVAEVERIEWKTAIWFDTKSNTYVLPVKKKIRESISTCNGSLEFSVSF